MNIKKLKRSYPLFIRHLEEELHYSKSTVRDYQAIIDLIFKLEKSTSDIKTYEEVYDYLVRETNLAASTLKEKRTKIKRIADFEELDQLPYYHEHSRPLFKKDKYSMLNMHYRNLIDTYLSKITEKGYVKSTVYSRRHILTGFFYHLQVNNITSLDMVVEDVVLGYFYDGEKELRGADYLQMIRSSIKILADTVQNVDFSHLLSFFPQKKKTKKIYPALEESEIGKIKTLLFNDNKKGLISKRDRAIVIITMYTGLRGCDIASLSINDINRENNELHIVQKKNGEELKLTILPCVSNAIYDYITHERPKHKNRFIFLTSDKDTRPITPQAVRLLAQKFFRKAGVRTDGGRKGLHLLRHYFATGLLNGGVSAPVISKVLGHKSPESLNAYVETDLTRLKACALSIANYQTGKDFFNE